MKEELGHRDQSECQQQNWSVEQWCEDRNQRFSRAEKDVEKLQNNGEYKWRAGQRSWITEQWGVEMQHRDKDSWIRLLFPGTSSLKNPNTLEITRKDTLEHQNFHPMVMAMTAVRSGSFQTYVESQDVLLRVCIWGVKEEPSMPFKFLH